MDKLTELKNLKLLLDEGAITKIEFESLKSEILNPINEKSDSEFEKIKRLFDDGLLSDEEFTNLKKELSQANESINVVEKQQVKSLVAENEAVNNSSLILSESEINDGIYFLEDASLLKDHKSLGDVSGFSGWGGLAESLGIKNAEKKIIRKTKKLNCNTVLIVGFSSPMGGVKIVGKAYKIDY